MSAAEPPIACTLGDDDVPGRVALLERLRGNVTRVERTDDGVLLHFALRPDVYLDVRRLTVEEQRCCAFWRFAVETVGDDLRLRWDAPPAAARLVDDLHAYFTGDRPLAGIGLLRMTASSGGTAPDAPD